MRLLIVEDDRSVANGLEGLLRKRGYAVDVVYTGVSGLDYALSNIYDLILLDVMLPEMDGLTVLKEIRREGVETPVMMMTARDSVQDRISGLDCGADDYLCKPFDPEELLARVRVLVRRRGKPLEEQEPAFGDLRLERSRMRLHCAEQSIQLAPKEFQLMEYLLSRKGRVISREYLGEKVWGMLSEAEYNTVEVYVSFLRRKLRALGSHVAIRSLRGVGYYLEVEK